MVSYFPLCLVQCLLESCGRAETDLMAQPVGAVIQQTHGEGELLMPGKLHTVRALQVCLGTWHFSC